MKYEPTGPPLIGEVPTIVSQNTIPVVMCWSRRKAGMTAIDENIRVLEITATVECEYFQGGKRTTDLDPYRNSGDIYYTTYDATLAGAQARSSLPNPHQAPESTYTIMYVGVPFVWYVGERQESHIKPGDTDTIKVGTFCLRGDHSASLPDYTIVYTHNQGVTMTVDDNEVTTYFGNREDENRSGRKAANVGNFTAGTTGLANVEAAPPTIPYVYINISQSCQHQSVEKIGAEDGSCTASVWTYTEPPTDDGLSGMKPRRILHTPVNSPVQFDNNVGSNSSSTSGKILSDQFETVIESRPGLHRESTLNRGNCGTDPGCGHNNTLQIGETIVLTGSPRPEQTGSTMKMIQWPPPIDQFRSVVYAQCG